ncbi:MAG: Sigma 54 modulation protein / ribosomal protein [Actinobacteria bacterium]|jgi:ribosomal subunit interface protein|nr:Sigma 54 modulation protein / ribosomal protein [Actinomycetota bacterium]MCW3044150.1 Sigma 54 modulation protein / ribosomal protein [Actinomycetota bacterium]
MDITVRSQHGHIPGSLQDLTASKMEGLGKFLRTITSIDVEVDRDGHASRSKAFLVRVAVMTPGPVFRSRVACDDPVAGIDVAVERLSRRLKEFKRRRSGRPLHSRPKTAPSATSGVTPDGISGGSIDAVDVD